MKKFLRLGEKIHNISISGTNISEFSIVLHSDGGAKGAPITPIHITKGASVLQSYIYKITDMYIPILYDTFPLKTKHEILIGGTNRENDFSRNEEFHDDGFVIKTKDGSLVINGGKRGVLYGIYTFLEKYLGLRFFTKDCERILNQENFQIDTIDIYFEPVFEYREFCDWTGWDPDFSVKSKINGSFVRKLRAEDGGSVGFAGGFAGLVHTFAHLVPASKFYKSHPEYYAEEEGGRRNPSGLCLRDDEMFEVALETARNWLRAEENPTLISVSINDGDVAYCRCEKCRAVLERGGNDTDNLIWFVNRMSRALKQEFPNVMVETISYGAVSEPPVFERPDKNVIIRVCGQGNNRYSLPDGVAKYLETGDPAFKSGYDFIQRIGALEKITEKIYAWIYPYNYYIINSPYPNLHTFLGSARYYAEHNVKGIYINGETDTCDFAELKFYLLSKVTFDPYMTEEEYEVLLDEFLEGYYGKGWKYIKKYIELTEKLCRSIEGSGTPDKFIPLKKRRGGGYDDTFIKRSRALFEKALAQAENAGEYRRIKKSSLQVDYYELYTLMDYIMDHGTEEEKAEIVRKNREVYEEFIKLGITRVVENAFLPVVKNFEQSPVECCYWDSTCTVSDRNNENTERELYVLLPVEGNCGEIVDVEFLYKTNNENARGYLALFGEDAKLVDSKINPTWKEYKRYTKIQLRGGMITNAYEFSKLSGIPLSDIRLNLLPIHCNGVIMRVEGMDPGAYLSLKELKVIK